jgi:hypothetical protein
MDRAPSQWATCGRVLLSSSIEILDFGWRLHPKSILSGILLIIFIVFQKNPLQGEVPDRVGWVGSVLAADESGRFCSTIVIMYQVFMAKPTPTDSALAIAPLLVRWVGFVPAWWVDSEVHWHKPTLTDPRSTIANLRFGTWCGDKLRFQCLIRDLCN